MRLKCLAIALVLIMAPAPSAAQNTTEPPVVAAPPPTKTEPAPPTTTPPTTTEEPVTEEPAEAPVVVREAPPEPEPMTIDPDAAYPNGFADPADPFGNDLSLARQQESGFPWGLLGLLGLLGLIPLFRQSGRTTRTVYVDRDDPRRVIREERIEE
jgi:outer membrane biosynthesis protein TonB